MTMPSPLPTTSKDRSHESPKSSPRIGQPIDSEVWSSRPTLKPYPDPAHLPSSPAHSRESSLGYSGANVPVSAIVSDVQKTANQSPRFVGSRSRAGSTSANSAGERERDFRTTAYGHHRQTSIVHGVQHSRNGSVASSIPSPMSPHMNVAGGPPVIDTNYIARVVEGDITSPLTNAATNPPFGSSATLVNERSTAAADSAGMSSTQKRIERMHSSSGRGRRDHSHLRSHSKQQYKEEIKTVSEYALHVLFTSFIAQADEKINQCITVLHEPEPQIEQICGPGIDPKFDQVILALGHIASQKPKALIDTLMLWRKNKSDAANEARAQLQQTRGATPASASLLRRNTEPLQAPQDTTELSGYGISTPTATMQEIVSQAERRSTVSIFILCRVLMEVIGQSTLACITPEMEEKLEGIIFGQLKIADSEQLALSPLKLANWYLFSQLLGVMSDINFESVANRFIVDLEKSQKELVIKTPTNREVEGKMELVLGGMKHLRIKVRPEEAWDQSCNFMLSLSGFFVKSHGQRLKYAYCHAFEALLLPIAATATSELNKSKWSDVVSRIGSRLATMFVKPRHWSVAFPLTATLLCVSPIETFSSQWLQLILPLQPKLKDRFTRPIALQAISRLLWTYLYRANDTPNATVRKLEEIVKLIFPAGRKSQFSTEPSVAEPLIEIIRIIGFKHQEFCFRNIIFPLINSEMFASGRDLKVEHLEPEKMVVGIRAFLAILSDIEKGSSGRPPFPLLYSPQPLVDRLPMSPIVSVPRLTTRQTLREAGERLSYPVKISALGDEAKDHYKRFCEILGKITIICDNAFGGQATLDEKFNNTPKTPIAETFTFSRRDDHQNPSDQRQGFYELLHVAVQALPRCLSVDIPFNSLVNLLCTGTAHVQYNIAESSARSLKSIARQSHAQQVTIGFARFIFNFNGRYSTMSDGGMLGPGHIESTLKLYVELLHIWIEEISQKSKEAVATTLGDSATDKRGLKLDLSVISAHVDEIESHGLFFLCSQSRTVRAFAVTVLQLITEFDRALGHDNMRIISILEGDSLRVMEFNDENLSVAERSRLQRGMRKSNSGSALIELCSSEVSYDTTLWFKIFPNLMRISYERCPVSVTLGRELICNRIMQMHKSILALADSSRGPLSAGDSSSRSFTRSATTPVEPMIEQWKLYLIFACTTISDKGAQGLNGLQLGQHTRKGSRPAAAQEQITSARTLFRCLIPLLSVSLPSVREAIVVAFGSINVNIYRTLLEELQGAVTRCNEEARARIHQRTNSSPRRNKQTDILRTEVTHVYHLTAVFLRNPMIYQDDWILNNLFNYTKDLKIFLMDGDVQMDWEIQKLRRHYCGLIEELYEGINRTKDPSRWMTFESRKSAFALMEDWCGYSPNQAQLRQREENMRQSMIDQQSVSERGPATAASEKEKISLRMAALSAMAALCGGPLTITTESRANLQFDIRRMLNWIDTIFSTDSDRVRTIGRRALKNLIIHNKEHPFLLERSIAQCYLTEAPKVLESNFEIITQILLEHEDYPMPFWRLLGIGLFTLGSEQSDLRSKAANILRVLEERQTRSSKIQDFDISITDKTKAVYKLAQFEISKRLSKQHPELAFLIFSEFTKYFKDLQSMAQRNMVAAILPWIQIIELQVDPNGGPTAQSYMLLANLYEITIRSSSSLHNEVQALWQALATGPHAGNVQVVLDFIMLLCLDRREQNFVEYAKQIVVFLSSTPAGVKVVEFLLMQITPKAMIPNEKREMLPPPHEAHLLPYVVDLSDALPVGPKQAGFSLGQLSLILLVDLMVSPIQLAPDNVPLLLQVVTVLWDHYTPLVQDQAREMLIHLMHELVISKVDESISSTTKKSIEAFVESVRRHDPEVVWAYDDNTGKILNCENNVPAGMEHLTIKVVENFALTYPGIKEQWAKLSLTWATSCPVRHLACRSFQIFRSIFTSLDQSMLADMLVRLSNTISDNDVEIQTFSMEILTTLKTLIVKLDVTDLITFPQLFWTTCACLNTINEREFIEAMSMLEELISKVDLSDPVVCQLLMEAQPPKWEGNFDALQPLLYKGLRSSASVEQTLDIIDKLVQYQNNDLVGDDSRLLFAILANFPRYLAALDQDGMDASTVSSATTLARIAQARGCGSIFHVLNAYKSMRYRISNEFMLQLIAAIKESFFPEWDSRTLIFLLSLLTNSIPWFKEQTMRILRAVIPEIDMGKPEVVCYGSDLISPLLRLLRTDFRMKALEVLDQITSITATPMDSHHLRMSMTESSAVAIRKEYERTQTLFGIPEESGWAIPMPGRYAETTRANVHAVFYVCQSAEHANPETLATPDVEFHPDDFQYDYFPPSDRADTMMSEDGRLDSNFSDLAMKLDSLDDFFEDTPQDPFVSGHLSHSLADFDGESYESGAQLYDEQTLPILHQSLGHNTSHSTFQNGFADMRPPRIGRETSSNAMNPTAFNPSLPKPTTARPTMHSRSVTSPSTPASYSAKSQSAFDDDDDDNKYAEALSDGDDERGPAMAEGSFFDNMIKPLAQGTRNGMRRLTGGRSRENEKLRDAVRSERKGMSAGPKSPMVPRVPSEYLKQASKNTEDTG